MDKDTKVIIPTKNVYFFIEKFRWIILWRILEVDNPSQKGASQNLPNVGGISMYQEKEDGSLCPECITGHRHLWKNIQMI